MRAMISVFWIAASLVSFTALETASAEVKPLISAGLRENYITDYEYGYGSVTMWRLKPFLEQEGYQSFTTSIRLSVASATDSRVQVPKMRTSLQDLHSITQRIRVADKAITIKPLISLKPGRGVAERLVDFNPKDPKVFFSSYLDALGIYFDLAKKYGITEIVLGVGMGHLWGPNFSDSWLGVARTAQKKCGILDALSAGSNTRLSIELTSEKDFEALESWKNARPENFSEFSAILGRVRVAGTYLPKAASWVKRAIALFPKLKVTLSNVSFVGVAQAVWAEDEVFVNDSELYDQTLVTEQGHNLLGAAPSEGWQKQQESQAAQFKQWLGDFDQLPEEIKTQIVEIEFRAASTDCDPPSHRADPRFLYYNELTRGFLKKWKQGEPLARSPKVPSRSLAGIQSRQEKKIACVYYDRSGPKDIIGAIHTPMLQSLLGAFPNWDTSRHHIKDYQKSDLEKCSAIFYIASNFNMEPPAGFYAEVAEASLFKPVVWMNYKFSNYVRSLETIPAWNGRGKLGFDAAKTEQPVTKPAVHNLDPGYYRYFDYKGEVFEKPARWNYQVGIFKNSPELNIVTITEPEKVSIISTARHSKNGTSTPYGVTRKFEEGGSIWYFNDLPFAFVDAGTPYFIFCDALWDILNETPPAGPRSALVRIEDVNASLNQNDLRWAIDYLADRGVPFSLAIIPYYANHFLNPLEGKNSGVWKPMDETTDFIGTLRYAKKRGAAFVFHGVEHMAGDLISGFDGQSGADYEFWMYPQNLPHPEDSSDYVLTKLERGEQAFRRAGLAPRVWESPHYAASALDYILFGKLFRWVYHRAIYFDAERTGDVDLPKSLRMFKNLSPEQKQIRRELLRQVKIDGDFHLFGGQVIPYPVYKDFYGQSVIPETLGFVDFPFYEDDPKKEVKHPEDLIREAKRLLVIRGAYASFFWHVGLAGKNATFYELHPKSRGLDGGRKTLRQLVEGIQGLGYQFRSIEDKTLFPD